MVRPSIGSKMALGRRSSVGIHASGIGVGETGLMPSARIAARPSAT